MPPVAALLAALTLAAAPAAEAPAVPPPPLEPSWLAAPTPPSSYEPADVQAWIRKNLIVEGYLQTGYNRNAVSFLSTDQVDVLDQDRVRIWLRFENFRASLVGDMEVRSIRILGEFDCRRRAYRHVAYELYPGNNMTGVPSTEDAYSAPWVPEEPNSSAAVNADVLCSVLRDAQSKSATPPKDPPAAPAAP